MRKEFNRKHAQIAENMQAFRDQVIGTLNEFDLQFTPSEHNFIPHTSNDPDCFSAHMMLGDFHQDARTTYLRAGLPAFLEQKEVPSFAALHYIDVLMHAPLPACMGGELTRIQAKSGQILNAEATDSGLIELRQNTIIRVLGRYITGNPSYHVGVKSYIYSFRNADEALHGEPKVSEEENSRLTNFSLEEEWKPTTQDMLAFLRKMLEEKRQGEPFIKG